MSTNGESRCRRGHRGPVLTHHYFDVDLDVLCPTITEDLPPVLDVFPDESPQPGTHG